MNNVHDYQLDNYMIDFEKQKIIMDISLEESNKRIIFSDFFCYHFSEEKPYSILSDLELIPIDNFFSENKEMLEREKRYAWPIMYDTHEELVEKILEADVQYYWVNSSYGLNGWVLAKNVSVIDMSKDTQD